MIGERLILIVDGTDLPRLGRTLAEVPRGSVLVQLRAKALSGRALWVMAEELRGLTQEAGVRLMINDRIDVALAVAADGAHLPETGLSLTEARRLLGPGRLLGASRHVPAAAAAACAAGADLVTVGPIWETPGKGPPLGLAGLGEACRLVSVETRRAAVFALGGIDSHERAVGATRAGAHGVAVLRAVPLAAELLRGISSRRPGQTEAAS